MNAKKLFAKKQLKALTAGVSFFILGAAANLSFAGDIAGGGDGVWTSVWGAEAMSIAGPRGFAVEVDGTFYTGVMPDGTYHYEIYGAVNLDEDRFDSKKQINQGRGEDLPESARRYRAVDVIASGHFNILGGTVQEDDGAEEPGSDGEVGG